MLARATDNTSCYNLNNGNMLREVIGEDKTGKD